MADSISLAPYTIEVRRLRQSEPSHLKFQEGEKGATLHGDFLTLLGQLKESGVTREDELQVLKVATLDSDETDIWGIIERGEYGSEARIVNAKSHDETHLQLSGEARLGRFYFRFHLPNSSLKGLLILQRTGRSGAYTTLHHHLEEEFRKKRQDFRLHFARAVHAEVLNEMLAGNVYGFKIVTYKPSSDITDWIKGKGAVQNVGEITISATATAEKSFWAGEAAPAWYKQILKDKKTVAELFPKEHIKSFQLTTDYRGQRRTFDLLDPEDIFPYQNITQDVQIGKNGHPTFDSINTAAVAALDELKVRLGITPPEVAEEEAS